MGERFVAAYVLVEELERRRPLNRERRYLRDRSNPFNIDDREFRKLYRLPKEGVMYLVEQLTPRLKERKRKTAIPIHLRVLSALSFYASGSYQRKIGQEYLHPMCQTEVSVSISCVSKAINRWLLSAWVKFPISQDSMQGNKERFMEKANFPGIIGAIDGTHIAITPPSAGTEHLFLNRKNFHSKNVQIVCNYDLEILSLNAKHGGRAHDSHVWRTSRLNSFMRENYLQGDRSSWLIGDSGYPVQPWLMTPYADAPEGSPEHRYNASHCSARNCVERCIGVWKGWFRCLRRDRTLHYSPEQAGIIINACAALHNMAIYYRVPQPPVQQEDYLHVPNEEWHHINVDELREGNAIRRRITVQQYT